MRRHGNLPITIAESITKFVCRLRDLIVVSKRKILGKWWFLGGTIFFWVGFKIFGCKSCHEIEALGNTASFQICPHNLLPKLTGFFFFHATAGRIFFFSHDWLIDKFPWYFPATEWLTLQFFIPQLTHKFLDFFLRTDYQILHHISWPIGKSRHFNLWLIDKIHNYFSLHIWKISQFFSGHLHNFFLGQYTQFWFFSLGNWFLSFFFFSCRRLKNFLFCFFPCDQLTNFTFPSANRWISLFFLPQLIHEIHNFPLTADWHISWWN